MPIRFLKIATSAAVVAIFLAFGLPVQASDIQNPPTKVAKKKKAKKSNAGTSSKATFKPGSQETRQERTARLTRECKDEVNAGACTGYTR